MTELLLEYGADPNLFGNSEVSPLMYNIHLLFKSDDEEKIRLLDSIHHLLEHGADPNYRGEQSGLSAMLVALNYELREAVDLLLEYGAVPSVEPAKIVYNYDPLGFKKYDENFDETWQSELHLFAANGYVDLLMPYIDGQVDPYMATPDGWDFFAYAVSGGHAEMVEALLPYCKDINDLFYDFPGVTADGIKRATHRSLLMIAVGDDSYDVAKLLLENGIDVNLIGYRMETIWMTARSIV